MNKLKISPNKILWVIVVLLTLGYLQSLGRISDLENRTLSLTYKGGIWSDVDRFKTVAATVDDLEHDLCLERSKVSGISQYLVNKDSTYLGAFSITPEKIRCR